MVDEEKYCKELQKIIDETKSPDGINENWPQVLKVLDQLSIEYAKELQAETGIRYQKNEELFDIWQFPPLRYDIAMDRNPTMTLIIAVLITTGIATLIPIADVMAQGNATAATNATSPQGNATAATNATSPHFIAKLTGESAFPPVTTNATGTAEFTVVGDGKTVQYSTDAEKIDQVTDAYLAYSTGGRFIDIVQLRASVDDGVTGPINGPLVEGNFTQADFLERARNAVPEMTDLLKIVLDGNAYVRVHTVNNPLGEIVGRVTPNMPS